MNKITSQYSKQDYGNAILFALNYPEQISNVKYDKDLDVWTIDVLDFGWYEVVLYGFLIRSCLKWNGIKQWQRIVS